MKIIATAVKTPNSVYQSKGKKNKVKQTAINKLSILSRQFHDPNALNYTTKPYTPKQTFNRTTV